MPRRRGHSARASGVVSRYAPLDMTPNPNPLVDEATLLDVLSHLRQYPQ